MTVPELLEREDFGRDEVVVLDTVVLERLGRGSVLVDGLLDDEGEVCARGRLSEGGLGADVIVGEEGGVVVCLKLRQWKREKKVGVDGVVVGVMAVEGEGEGEEDGEMDSFILSSLMLGNDFGGYPELEKAGCLERSVRGLESGDILECYCCLASRVFRLEREVG